LRYFAGQLIPELTASLIDHVLKDKFEMPDVSKTLIFLTDCFPFGSAETFIENEFPFLVGTFDRIFIITANSTDTKTRTIPENIEITRISFKPLFKYKVLAVLNFFNPIIQNEIKLIKEDFLLKVNKEILFVTLASYAKALEVNDLLNKMVSQHGIDTRGLYVYSYWMNNITAGITLFKSKNPEVRAICRVHRWDVYFETQNPPYLPLRHFMISTLDKVYCISYDALGYLQSLTKGRLNDHLVLSRLGTFNRDKIVALPNVGMIRLVSCSNLIPLKRVHLIIEALTLINDIKIDWRHFGKGPLEEELKKLAAEKLSGKSNIEYSFVGQISNTQMLSFYKNNKVDLFINVSETEGIPVSIIEASSFGVVAIGTLVGGVGEILQEGENGFLLRPSCSPQDIVNTIKKFYGLDEAAKKRIRENAAVIWEQNYSAEKNYSNFLHSVLGLGSAAPVKAN
jgi:glycosyltransferase involved in cell wall biosynthesis